MTAPIIEIDGVSKSFDPIQVLRELSFHVGPGEKLALIGPSGSGKTTILRFLMTLETIDAGHIKVDGEHLWHMQRNGGLVPANEGHLHQMRRKIGMVLVAGRTRDDQITVADLTGTGVQDTAIATLAHRRAEAAGAVTSLES